MVSERSDSERRWNPSRTTKKLQYPRQIVMTVEQAGTVITENGTQNRGGGKEEGRPASLEEPILDKEQWETVCWGEVKLVLKELVKILI